MHDAIVVGARCTGSPTAMLLARNGYRVLLVDRAIFPSNTISNHYIQQSAVAQLKRWGFWTKWLLQAAHRSKRLLSTSPVNEALADYERQHNESLMPLYELVCKLATSLKAASSPEEIQFLAALQGNQKEIDRFWGVEAGTVAVQDFFSQENIQQIISAAAVGA